MYKKVRAKRDATEVGSQGPEKVDALQGAVDQGSGREKHSQTHYLSAVRATRTSDTYTVGTPI